ncbi:predicted protein [Arabidopsis lyrata subsp. lyrata]|uniref:Predicted protein n=1 Tax=Arabidopsis lyrata subsp. lyrata TaxID=81972 RepID=D7KU96_ARALL|nr:predicted protein [Arabidopsis lyrata subsp. lyrata]EFH46623.1 predicted protein [Arabidopsis lyrata subsp. lyrata]EFH63647.1 predicted protein [Arabidopsis lyrata subsp. lyrata]EFH64783.1 predicted protein [Arabidopsis lyrata subsp. lyrata]
MITKHLLRFLQCKTDHDSDNGNSGQHHVRQRILGQAKLLNPMPTNPLWLSLSPSKPKSPLLRPRS